MLNDGPWARKRGLMRIGPNSPLTSWFNRITDRDAQNRDDQSHSNQGKERDSDAKKDEREEVDFDVKADIEKIEKALEWFAKDSQARKNGLTADKDGKGPGLRVILKDAAGAVIRRLTPGEFLKLQEAQANPTIETVRMSGKILDRKY